MFLRQAHGVPDKRLFEDLAINQLCSCYEATQFYEPLTKN